MPDSTVTTMLEWTTAYAVGVRQLDEEHKHLFAVAESLHRAMMEGQGKAVLHGLLMDLIAYTSYHFAHEEELMRRIGYPDYLRHQKQHEELRLSVRTLLDRADSGQGTMTIEVMQFLMGWLRGHIPTSDLAVAGYLKRTREAPTP
jgi:hemerythrin-like metal-binding protein